MAASECQKIQTQRSRGNRPRQQRSPRPGNTRSGDPPFPKELKKAGPPPDPKTPKVISGISYYFCEHHKKWGKHATAQCKAAHARKKKVLVPGGDVSRIARAARAIAAVATGEDE